MVEDLKQNPLSADSDKIKTIQETSKEQIIDLESKTSAVSKPGPEPAKVEKPKTQNEKEPVQSTEMT